MKVSLIARGDTQRITFQTGNLRARPSTRRRTRKSALKRAGRGYRLHYWRTAAGDEVDFVLYGERGLRAFEVKMDHNVRPDDLRGLLRFRADFHRPRRTCCTWATAVGTTAASRCCPFIALS